SADTKILLSAYYDYRKSDQGGSSLRPLAGTFGTGGFSADALGAGFYDSIADFGPPGFTARTYGISARVEHEFSNATLTSITAYGRLKSPTLSDLEVSPTPFANTTIFAADKSFSQELQLAS